MPDISAPAPTGYLSDGEILAWVEEKSNQQYANVRELMHNSETAGNLEKDLTQLKADMDQGLPSDQIVQEMNDIEVRYADTPFAGEVHDLLGPMETALTPVGLTDDEQARADALWAEITDEHTDADTVSSDMDEYNALVAKNAPPNIATYSESFGAKIEAETDQLNRMDQVGLITIQADMNDAHQTAQLASSLVASDDQTKSGIISNFRG